MVEKNEMIEVYSFTMGFFLVYNLKIMQSFKFSWLIQGIYIYSLLIFYILIWGITSSRGIIIVLGGNLILMGTSYFEEI